MLVAPRRIVPLTSDPGPLTWLLSLALALAVAEAARRTRVLTHGGAALAVPIGAACVLAGWDWAALLLFFFATSAFISAWRGDTKRALLASYVEKGGARDAAQVIANGAVFAVAALGTVFLPHAGWHAIGAGAIAAATADTWATEIGTVLGGTPRHVLTGTPLPAGASGGMSLAGTAASVAGAFAAAAAAWALQWNVPALAIVAGGIGGSIMDSLLGATIQERRWCAACGRATERRVHNCGASTARRGGLAGFDNDAVNLTSVLAGALITRLLS